LTSVFSQIVEAKPHTPVYTMHKYFARRPWNVFNELISHYSKEGDIVLDPFCGGGVTVVESLKLGRKAIGVDANPLATYVTEMECRPLSLTAFQQALIDLGKNLAPEISQLYRTKCQNCTSETIADWIEWDETEGRIFRIKYHCQKCAANGERAPTQFDSRLAKQVNSKLEQAVQDRMLWYPRTRVPTGDKTNSLLSKNIRFFHELFTKRNLLALSMLFAEVNRVENPECRDFLRFVFSSSLKWASRQSHLRGKIVEGWAMHAYWIYPKSLEINVWSTFCRRAQAILRGKQYSNEQIGQYFKHAKEFNDIATGNASCLVLHQSSTELPIPNDSVDAIITDPPYGGNVNYSELSDYWQIWLNEGTVVDKSSEIIINRSQGKRLEEYESLLSNVLKECYRVLKPNRYLLSTFNSRDIRVVASFITGAARAGFTLKPEGLIYQAPIRSYTTTFHAMQIGAFVGDFVFTFVKETNRASTDLRGGLEKLKATLAASVEGAVAGEITEPQLREQAYRSLIPFLAYNARDDPEACTEAVDFLVAMMKEREQYFRQLRKKIVARRKRKFSRRD
jgi:SAM-dependent methyltransferase